MCGQQKNAVLGVLLRDLNDQFQVFLGVCVDDVGPFVAEAKLGGFDAVELSGFGRVGVPELIDLGVSISINGSLFVPPFFRFLWRKEIYVRITI
jgi:hypothetical protein